MSLFNEKFSYDVTYDAISKFDATKDVQPVFQAIATVIHMSNVGRKEGLLALEEKLDNHALQCVMRDVESSDMKHCAAVFSDEAHEFIFRNMSQRLRIITIKELLYIASKISWKEMDSDFLYAANHVENVIHKLEARGEIVLWRE